MNDSEVADLCRRIYREHREAMDLIIKHRPNRPAEMRNYLKNLLCTTPNITFEGSPRVEHIQFTVPEWDADWLRVSTWTRSKRLLLFQFLNLDEGIRLELLVGPGPDETREALIERAREHMPPFVVMYRKAAGFTAIFETELLNRTQLASEDFGEVERQFRDNWIEFVEDELPVLIQTLDLESCLPASSQA